MLAAKKKITRWKKPKRNECDDRMLFRFDGEEKNETDDELE